MVSVQLLIIADFAQLNNLYIRKGMKVTPIRVSVLSNYRKIVQQNKPIQLLYLSLFRERILTLRTFRMMV